jgi:hypothetical protein
MLQEPSLVLHILVLGRGIPGGQGCASAQQEVVLEETSNPLSPDDFEDHVSHMEMRQENRES